MSTVSSRIGEYKIETLTDSSTKDYNRYAKLYKRRPFGFIFQDWTFIGDSQSVPGGVLSHHKYRSLAANRQALKDWERSMMESILAAVK